MPKDKDNRHDEDGDGVYEYHLCSEEDNDRDDSNDTKEEENDATGSTRTHLQQQQPSFRKKLSRKISSRRKSFVLDTLERPNTMFGWSVVLSGLCSAGLGYELSLQKQLTRPPLVFGQTSVGTLKKIHEHLTRSKDSILSRPIQPTLLMGTRSVLASTAAYALGGPSHHPPKDTKQHDQQYYYLRFRQMLTSCQDGAKFAIDWELPPNTTNNRDDSDETHTTPAAAAAAKATKRESIFRTKPIQQPVVLVLHGINNDANFGYMRSLMRTFTNRGWVAAGMNYRGCGGVPLATPRSYTGAFTGDLREVVRHIASRLDKNHNVPLLLVGNSIGANIVVKYVGEEGLAGTLPACVAGCVSLGNPLGMDSSKMSFPWNYILSVGVKKSILVHLKSMLNIHDPNFQRCMRRALCAGTLGDLDNALAPIFIKNDTYAPFTPSVGYVGRGKEYWQDASSYRVVQHVSVPLLLVKSQDDFLIYGPASQKLAYCLENPNVMVVNTKCGGHLGWQERSPNAKNMFSSGTSWADLATADFIEAVLLQWIKTSTVTKGKTGDSNYGPESTILAQHLPSRL